MQVISVGLDTTTIELLRQKGVTAVPEEVEDVDDLEHWLAGDEFDGAIVDLDHADLSIFFPKTLRGRKVHKILIGLSANPDQVRQWSEHRAIFLENGGDDLIHSPANPREVAASLLGASRRMTNHMADTISLRADLETVITIDRTVRTIMVNHTRVALTSKEQLVFFKLASRPNEPMSKEMLLNASYIDGVEDMPESKIIDVFICKLRKKLSDISPSAGRCIETTWGRGYFLNTRLLNAEVAMA